MCLLLPKLVCPCKLPEVLLFWKTLAFGYEEGGSIKHSKVQKYLSQVT